MRLSYKILSPEGIEQYAGQLCNLEQQMRYPLAGGEDSFVIDHGKSYHPFFSEMGRSRFALFFDGDRVIGSIAGVWKSIWLGDDEHTALYAADLKLAPKYRGHGLFKRLLWRLIFRWTHTADFQGWDCVYYIAMQGAKGGVSRSFKPKMHLGRLSQPAAQFALFFVQPVALQNLQMPTSFQAEGAGLRLSQVSPELLQYTTGRKDFMLDSTGAPWKLAHLGLVGSDSLAFAHRLRAAGERLHEQSPTTLLCFAVDERRGELIAWLSAQGIVSDTFCRLGSVSFFCPSLRKADWADISTAEI